MSKMDVDVVEEVNEKKEPNKKLQFLSLKSKIDILNKLQDGVKPVRIAKEYGIALSTISRLKKCKTSLREAMNMYQNNSDRRSLRGTFHPQMESALHQWYLDQTEKGVPVTGSVLRLKAREINKKIRENDLEFRASPGWMDKFKKRYGIRLKSSRGERQTTDNIAFEFDDNEETEIPITHVEIKTEMDKDVLCEPQFVTVEDDRSDAVDRIATGNNGKDVSEVMRSVDEVIQWSVDNKIEALYLTMLKSLRERIRYQARA